MSTLKDLELVKNVESTNKKIDRMRRRTPPPTPKGYHVISKSKKEKELPYLKAKRRKGERLEKLRRRTPPPLPAGYNMEPGLTIEEQYKRIRTNVCKDCGKPKPTPE